jgi:hypothetical protein
MAEGIMVAILAILVVGASLWFWWGRRADAGIGQADTKNPIDIES